MRVTWQIDDGYAGPSRPQHVEVDDEELAECETDEERERLIEDTVQEDFNQKVSWYIVSKE